MLFRQLLLAIGIFALVAVLGLLPAGTSTASHSPGLVAHWSFDDGTADDAAHANVKNDGTLTNGASISNSNVSPKSKNDQSLVLDGVDDYVQVADNASLGIKGSITMAAWVYPTARKNSNQNAYVIDKQNDYFLIADCTTGSCGTNRVAAGLGFPTNMFILDSGQTIPLDQWSHIAFTYDITIDANDSKIYIDGVLVKSGTFGAAKPIANNNDPVRLGCYSNSGGSCTKSWAFPGNIDEARLYDKALSASEIAALADTTDPNDPTSLSSTSHTIPMVSFDNTVDVEWSGASDKGSPASGLDGYSIVWDTNAATVPDNTVEVDHPTQTNTSPPLADGNSHWFHLSTCDKAGNCTNTLHLGPFFIDTTPPDEQININVVDKLSGAKLEGTCWRISYGPAKIQHDVVGDDTGGVKPDCGEPSNLKLFDKDPSAGNLRITITSDQRVQFGSIWHAQMSFEPKGNLDTFNYTCNLSVAKCEIGPVAVGGIAVDLDGDLGDLPVETAGSSGSNTGLIAGIVAAIAAGTVTLGGAAWYARRRWAR